MSGAWTVGEETEVQGWGIIPVTKDKGEAEFWVGATGDGGFFSEDNHKLAASLAAAANAHDELLAGLQEIDRCLGYGQIFSASKIIADLLAKHGGAA